MPNRSKKEPRSLKRPTSSGGGSEPSQSSGAHKSSINNTEDFEALFRIEDNKLIDLPSPRIPVTDTVHVLQEHNPTQPDSPEGNFTRNRVRALTSTSAKSPTALSRESWKFKPASNNGSRVWSGSFRDSAITQDPNFAELSPVSASTITESPERKKKSKKGASRRKPSESLGPLKYIRSPHDYMLIDLDYCEAQAAMNSGPSNGLNPEIWKSSFDELLTYVRRVTGTEVVAISANDSKLPRRPNEARAWDHRNLWCIDCRKSCPICNTTCCAREEAVQKASDEKLSPEEVQQATRLAKIIEFLGVYAKDVSTFSQCTPSDGCGRYICPSCCGVCPNEICRDIQCKECKPNVWDSCDWHD